MLFTDFIWDFDGMLFDTYPRMCGLFQRALRQMGCERPADEVMNAIKITVRQAARDYAARYGFDAQALLTLYHALDHAEPIDSIVPYPGAGEFLRAVMAQGGRHYLYTHRDAVAVEALRLHGLDDCFTGFVTADDHFPPKPAPNALLHLIRTFNLDPFRAVMLGDRDIDIEAAKNARLSGCLVDPGHYYDGYETPLRASCIDGLYAALDVPRLAR